MRVWSYLLVQRKFELQPILPVKNHNTFYFVIVINPVCVRLTTVGRTKNVQPAATQARPE